MIDLKKLLIPEPKPVDYTDYSKYNTPYKLLKPKKKEIKVSIPETGKPVKSQMSAKQDIKTESHLSYNDVIKQYNKQGVPVEKQIVKLKQEYPSLYNDLQRKLNKKKRSDKLTAGQKIVMGTAGVLRKAGGGALRGVTAGMVDDEDIIKGVGKIFGDTFKDRMKEVRQHEADLGVEKTGEYVKFAGDFLGGLMLGKTIASGFQGAKFFKPIKNTAIKMATIRGLTTASTVGGRNMINVVKGNQSLKDAFINTGVSTGASLFSLLPENYVKPGISNLVSQVGGDMAFEIASDIALGRFEKNKEYWKEKGLNSIPSAVFGIMDYMNPNFKLQQKAFQQGVNDIKHKTGNVLKNQIDMINKSLDMAKLKLQENQGVGITPYKKGINLENSKKIGNKSLKTLYNSIYKEIAGEGFFKKPKEFSERLLTSTEVESIIKNPKLSQKEKVDKVKRVFKDSQTGLISPEGYDLLKLKNNPQAMMDINNGQAIDKLSTSGMEAIIDKIGHVVRDVADKNGKLGVRIGGDEFGIMDGGIDDMSAVNNIIRNIKFKIQNVGQKKLKAWQKFYDYKKAKKIQKVGAKEGELFAYDIIKQKNGKYTVVIDNIQLSGGTAENQPKASYLIQKAKQQGLDGVFLDKNKLDTVSRNEYIKIKGKGGDDSETTRIFNAMGRRQTAGFTTSKQGICSGLRGKTRNYDITGRYNEDYALSFRASEKLEKDFQRLTDTFSYLQKTDPKKWADLQEKDNNIEKFTSAMRQMTDDRTGNTFLKKDIYDNNNYRKSPQVKINNPNVGIVNKVFGDTAGDNLIINSSQRIKQILLNTLKGKLSPEEIDLMAYRLSGGGNLSIVDNNKILTPAIQKKLINEIQENLKLIKVYTMPVDMSKINSVDLQELRAKGIEYSFTKKNKNMVLKNFSNDIKWLPKGVTEDVEVRNINQKLQKPKLSREDKLKIAMGQDGYKKFLRKNRAIVPVLRHIIRDKGSLPEDIVFADEDYQQAKSFEKIEQDHNKAYEFVNKHIPSDDYDKLVNEAMAEGQDDPANIFIRFKNRLNDITDALLNAGEGSHDVPTAQKDIAKDWIGSKQLQNFRARMLAENLQKEIAKALGEDKKHPSIFQYEKKGEPVMTSRAKMYDMAMQLLLDVGGNKDKLRMEYEQYKNALPSIYKNITLMALDMPGELNNITSMYQKMYSILGKQAQDAGIIRTLRDNYTARHWQGRSSTEGSSDNFKRSTKHAKQRVYGSILEGVANGDKLQVKGASNSLMYYMQDIYNVIQDRSFIKMGSQLIVDDDGNRMFETKNPGHFQLIKHPAFKKYENVGKVGQVRDELTGEILNEPQLKNKDLVILGDGYVLRAKEVYAPKEIAGYLNNILGNSALKDIPLMKQLLQINNKVKQTILTTSLFHHRALTQSYLLGGHIKYKNLNPVQSYRIGLKLASSLNPVIQTGIKNGLTLDYQPGFLEKTIPQTYKTGIKGMLLKWNRSLFERYASGLKAMAFKHEFERQLNIHQKQINKSIERSSVKGLDKYKPGDIKNVPDYINEIAEKSASLINDDFGGLNLQRMGRNKTLQDMARLVLLATDWTESNLRSAFKAIPFRKDKITGKIRWAPKEAEPYMKFWGRIFAKSFITANLINYALNGTFTFDNKDKDKKMDIDITKLVDPKGKTKKRYYFSIIGHFRDPLKMVKHPVKFFKHKASPLASRAIEQATGRDWAERPFTPVKELLKTGSPVKRSVYDQKEKRFWPTAPSRALNILQSSMPIQAQSMKGFLDGTLNGIEAIMRSLGAPIEVRYQKKKKEDIYQKYKDIYKDYENIGDDVYKKYRDPYKGYEK